ncbi:MAG: mechanosensitive ion channel family protein [Sphingobacteriia bacterium]|nr:MAG: mechanosensitive ion channel family protein [Sphingobacteriia bacterium]
MEKLTSLLPKLENWFFTFGPKLLAALLVFVVGLTLINWLSRLISKTMGRRNVEASLQTFLASLVSVGLKILLLITVAGMLGIETTSFVAIIGALGLAVGLALQGSLANFAGGVLILVFKPFKLGDLIESGGQKGLVKEIQIFNTILLTGDHKTIILANGAVSNGTIINHTKMGSLRVDIDLPVAGDQDIAAIKALCIETVTANPKVLVDPAPACFVGKLADGGAVVIAIRVFTEPALTADVYPELLESLKANFDKAGIRGPLPTSRVIAG